MDYGFAAVGFDCGFIRFDRAKTLLEQDVGAIMARAIVVMVALQPVDILNVGNTPARLVVMPSAIHLDAHHTAVMMMRHNGRRDQHRRRHTNKQG